MSALDFLNSPDLTALAGIAAMIVGGATLIASGVPNRREASLAARIRLVSPAAVRAPVRSKPSSGPVKDCETSRARRQSLRGRIPSGRPNIFPAPRRGRSRDSVFHPCSGSSRAGALGAFGLFVAGHVLSTGSPLWEFIVATGSTAIAGWIAPILWISRQIKRRIRSVAAGLPNALELLVVCVEAGLSLEDGLHRVAE